MKTKHSGFTLAVVAFFVGGTLALCSDEPHTNQTSRIIASSGNQAVVSPVSNVKGIDSSREGPLIISYSEDDLHALASVFGEEAVYGPYTNQTAAQAVQADRDVSADDLRYRPPENWSPKVEWDVVPERGGDVLRVAYAAKRGLKYSEALPIRVSETNGTFVVRFPFGTNAPPGECRYGPTWAAIVTLDAKSLRVLHVTQDPD